MSDKKSTTKYIFVTGGVLSGLGKGITAASIGNLLKSRGLSVNIQKLDPYLNVDAGTLNPAEHGETFVTADGAETDLDLGHYERFLDVELSKDSSIMSGRILRKLIEDERAGKYLGKTVQVVPHFVNAIKEYAIKAAEGFDVHIIEIGGTVGDYESPAFFEAIRQIPEKVGRDNCLYVQVVYLPFLEVSQEFKTKPAQNATRDLRALGIMPDILVARCERPIENKVKNKLADFCGIPKEAIALLPNAESVYQVPLTLEKNGIGGYIADRFNLKTKPQNISWGRMVGSATKKHSKTVNIGIVAKYMDNSDTYMSVVESVKSAGFKAKVNTNIVWVDAEKVETSKNLSNLDKLDGMIVPGGFGERGIEGKIKAVRYAMKKDIPYLGICLGMQVAAVGFARENGIIDANLMEVNEDAKNLIIHIMDGQKGKKETGGTMRLGNYPCNLSEGSLARMLYASKTINERHRHRYEFNNQYREKFENRGMIFSGLSPDGKLVEIIEIPKNKFFIASQFHPEFNSRPNRAHPLFSGLISACLN